MNAFSKIKPKVKVTLLSIDKLKPHEKGLPLYFELLKKEIARDGMLKCPIIVEESTYVILDGMHRWLALKSLGYLEIPVILVDSSSLGIRVAKRRVHQYMLDATNDVNIIDVVSAGLGNKLMEPRSTRHFFPFSKRQEIDCLLNSLKKGPAQDVTGYLSEKSSEESEAIMVEWLEEISEELEFLAKRKREVENEKLELTGRVESLRRCSPLSR